MNIGWGKNTRLPLNENKTFMATYDKIFLWKIAKN